MCMSLNIFNETPVGRLTQVLRATFLINELKRNQLSMDCTISNLNLCKFYIIYGFNKLYKLLQIVYKIIVLVFHFIKFVIILFTYFAEFNLMFLEYFFITSGDSFDTTADD